MTQQSGMTEEEAFPNTYPERKNAWYNPGDGVKVGPSFRHDGRYYADGHEGPYTVIRLETPGYYYLVKGNVPDPSEYASNDCLVCSVGRLTRR